MRTLVAVLLAAAALPAAALADTPPQTLSVLGHGVARVAPDTADLSIGVDATAPTAVGARNSVNSHTAAIITSVTALGVDRSAIQTADTGLRRSVVRRRGKRIVRWLASSSLEVHVTDLAKVSPVLDAATKAGATNFDGPSFGFSNPSAGRQAAEAAALADARARADSAATAVGMHVTGVQSIDLDPNRGGVLPMTGQATAGAPTTASPTRPTPVEPGTEEVDADVAVVYLLGS